MRIRVQEFYGKKVSRSNPVLTSINWCFLKPMLSLFSGKQTNSGVRRKDRENRARVWRGENNIKSYYLLEWLSERRTCKLSWGQHRIFHQHQIVILVRTVGQHCEEIICSSAWVSLEKTHSLVANFFNLIGKFFRLNKISCCCDYCCYYYYYYHFSLLIIIIIIILTRNTFNSPNILLLTRGL